MPKGGSGGKRTTSIGGGGGGITLNLRSFMRPTGGIPDNASVAQVEQHIQGQGHESLAIFGNDRRLLSMSSGRSGEVTLSSRDLRRYGKDIRIMTHNHPVDLQLSTGDLLAAAQLGQESGQGFEELRAVSGNGSVYRARRPSSGKWPTQRDIQTSIQNNTRSSFEKARRARRRGASKDDAFQLYQDDLTRKVSRETGIRLSTTNRQRQPLQLFNTSQIPGERTQAGTPTAETRRQYGFPDTQSGERRGAFPIFDEQSAIAALRLRGHARTQEGRQNIITRAQEYAPENAQKALQRDLKLNSIELSNFTQSPLRTQSGAPTMQARRQYGFTIPGEREGAFPIFDVQSATAALQLRGRARTQRGRQHIIEQARKFAPMQADIALQNDQKRGIVLQNVSQEAYRTAGGRPTAQARREYGMTVSGERQGAFPIFDEQSAVAAIRLRGHAQTQRGRQNILERAAQYSPESAAKAWMKDSNRRTLVVGTISTNPDLSKAIKQEFNNKNITLKNRSQSMSTFEKSIINNDRETMGLVDQRGRVIANKSGTNTHVNLPILDMLKHGNSVEMITHNHPVESTLSFPDLSAASKLNAVFRSDVKGIRAVAPSGKVHELRAKDGKYPDTAKVNRAILSNIDRSYQDTVRDTKRSPLASLHENMTKNVSEDLNLSYTTKKVYSTTQERQKRANELLQQESKKLAWAKSLHHAVETERTTNDNTASEQFKLLSKSKITEQTNTKSGIAATIGGGITGMTAGIVAGQFVSDVYGINENVGRIVGGGLGYLAGGATGKIIHTNTIEALRNRRGLSKKDYINYGLFPSRKQRGVTLQNVSDIQLENRSRHPEGHDIDILSKRMRSYKATLPIRNKRVTPEEYNELQRDEYYNITNTNPATDISATAVGLAGQFGGLAGGAYYGSRYGQQLAGPQGMIPGGVVGALAGTAVGGYAAMRGEGQIRQAIVNRAAAKRLEQRGITLKNRSTTAEDVDLNLFSNYRPPRNLNVDLSKYGKVEKRPLDPKFLHGTTAWKLHHARIKYGRGETNFTRQTTVGRDTRENLSDRYENVGVYLNKPLLQRSIRRVKGKWDKTQNTGAETYNLIKHNCQHYVGAVLDDFDQSLGRLGSTKTADYYRTSSNRGENVNQLQLRKEKKHQPRHPVDNDYLHRYNVTFRGGEPIKIRKLDTYNKRGKQIEKYPGYYHMPDSVERTLRRLDNTKVFRGMTKKITELTTEYSP